MVYILDQDFGVRQIQDQAGNTVTYTDNGIVHSSGTRVDFIRDSEGRITDIVLPDGRRLKYSYDAKGDLVRAADPADLATTYGYVTNIRYPHYLQDITDARGIKAIRHEYDDDGRLVKTFDADGNPIIYEHNIAGKTEIIKNRRGFSTVYTYDANGWVLLEKNALGEEKTWTYDQNGSVLTQTDGLNRKTEFTVDPRGNELTEKDPLGNVTTRTWNYYNKIKTEIDPLGRIAERNKYKVNTLAGEETGYLEESFDALGNREFFSIDICGDPTSCSNSGNVLARIDPVGARTGYEYNDQGYKTQEINALGHEQKMLYDSMGRLTKKTVTQTINGEALLVSSNYVYDAKGRLIESKSPDGSNSKTSYNAIDKPASEVDSLGQETKYEYDNRGNEVKIIYADNTFEETGFDENGNEVLRRDRLGRVTRMVYDAADRLVEMIYPDTTPLTDLDNPRTSTVYDAGGQSIAQIDARGNRTEFAYDAGGRQTMVKDALGNITELQYDAAGQKIAMIDALGRKTKYVYDAAGRLGETVFPDVVSDDGDDSNNPRVYIAFDAAGRRISQTDEEGRTTRFAFDIIGRVTRVVLPNPATGANPELIAGESPANSGTLVTKFSYDEQGNRLSQADAEGRITQWTYDKLGRNLTRRLPMGQIDSHEYNLLGERTKYTDFNGVSTLFEFDNMSRMSKTKFANSRERAYRYDAEGQLTEIDDGGQTYAFNYDERGRLSRATDPYGRSIDYKYDADGNRSQLKTPKQLVDFRFDALSRLNEVVASIDGGEAQRTLYRYDALGNRAGMTQPNNSVVSYQYDRRNRLTQLHHQASAAINAPSLLKLDYTLEKTGLRIRIDESRPGGTSQPVTLTRTSNYLYDKVLRLTSETVNGNFGSQNRTSSFTYDRVGNRKTETTSGTINKNASYTYDANDRLIAEPNQGLTYTYDDNGNLVNKKSGSVVQAAYRWDEENHMTGATIGSGAAQKIMSYAYDPNGIRRAQEEVSGAVRRRTEYVVDANQSYAQVVEEWSASGASTGSLTDETLVKSYVYGDDLISQTLAALGSNPAKTSVYHYDGLGTTRALSDGTTGAITDRYAYTAFGETDPAPNSGWNLGSTDNNYLYAGEQKDMNLGFYYLRARYMDPSNGRFVGMDSYAGNMQDPISLHKYVYANQNPTMGIDPSGNMTLGEIGTAMRIAVSQVTSGMLRGSRVFLKAARSVAKYWIGTAKRLVMRCIKKPEKCDLDTPLLIEGNDTPQTSQHVRDAQLGAGSNMITSGVQFHRIKPGHSRGWLRSTSECNSAARLKFGRPGVCDEFPYASAREGGQKHHPMTVSLRLTDKVEGAFQGVKIKAFYAICRIQPNKQKKSQFLVAGMPEVPSFVLPPPLSCFDSK